MLRLRFLRLAVRFSLGVGLVVSVTSVALVLLYQSEQLEGVPGEAWTLLGGAMLGLTTALAIVARAIAKNPTDNLDIHDEDDLD